MNNYKLQSVTNIVHSPSKVNLFIKSVREAWSKTPSYEILD